MHVVVTGANGFVGTALCNKLAANKISYTALVRKKSANLPSESSAVVEDFFDLDKLTATLPKQTSTIVHLAARVHQPKDTESHLYTRENVELTKMIVMAAVALKIPHVILVSTIKVYGEFRDEDFTVHSPCHPLSEYGKTKWEAEQVAKQICKAHGINLDIVRIPLVVGPQAKGNLGAIAKLLKMGFPLPFAGIQNRRSFLRVDTLVERLVALANANEKKSTQGEVWVHAVAEQEPLTTSALLSVFAAQRDFQIHFFKLPTGILKLCCFVIDCLQNGFVRAKKPFAKSADKLLGSAVLVPGSKQE